MAIKLEEHKVFIASHQMEMVPYSVAKAALEEVTSAYPDDYLDKLEEALQKLQTSVNNIDFND